MCDRCGPDALASGLTQDHRPWTVQARREEVLEFMRQHDFPVSAATIERELGWHPSTVPPILVALRNGGKVLQRSNGKWALTTGRAARRIKVNEVLRGDVDLDELVGRQMTIYLKQEGQEEDMPRYTDMDGHVLNDARWAQQFLNQGDLWQDGDEQFLSIQEMDPTHAKNAVASLMRSAPGIVLTVAVNETNHTGGDEEAIAWQGLIADPVKARLWLLETDLIRALLAQAEVSSITRAPWTTRRRLLNASIR